MVDVVDLSIPLTAQVTTPLPVLTVRNFADELKTARFGFVTVTILDSTTRAIIQSSIADSTGVAQFALVVGEYHIVSGWSERVGGIEIRQGGADLFIDVLADLTIDVVLYDEGEARMFQPTLAPVGPYNPGQAITVTVDLFNIGDSDTLFVKVHDQTVNLLLGSNFLFMGTGGLQRITVPVTVVLPEGQHTWIVEVGHVE